MGISDQHRHLLALCAIRIAGHSADWSLIAREAQRDPSLGRLLTGQLWESSAAARRSRPILDAARGDEARWLARVDEELALGDEAGAHLVTVLDDSYPANLRLIPNRPPFLFIRGEIADGDVLAVAVVGTRKPSADGLDQARKMSALLTDAGVTVVSGLARGVDTAAHEVALDTGGRTIAVLGTGITRCYPAENAELAERIVDAGALVSQFWPSSPPGRHTFPRRNVVTSGISQGTVVIEASSTSGAKMQARLALQHGKQVFLLDPLVTHQEWARDYIQKRGAIPITEIADVLDRLADPDKVRESSRHLVQLELGE
jgi:DNA processing protein